MPEYKGFVIRDGKDGDTDRYVINEPYYNHLVTEPTDVVMDIGAHIGTFVKRVADKTTKVYCYEPDSENFRLLQLNTEEFSNVELYNKAVIAGDEKRTELWLGNPSIHSTVQYRGRSSITVPAVNFHHELSRIKPSLLKIDIEGGEYSFWDDLVALPDFVKCVAFEIHLNRPEWRKNGPILADHIEGQGFEWLLKPRFTQANWTTNVIGRR